MAQSTRGTNVNTTAPSSVIYAGNSSPAEPFQGESFTLNNASSTRVQNVTPDHLRDMRNNPGTAHEGVSARTSVLPERREIFDRGAMMRRIANRIGLRQRNEPQPIRHVETPLGVVQGQTVLDVPIQIIPARTTISSDDRLPSRERDRGSENTFVRVGAVEIALEGLAATGTDNVLAAVLYDARHANPQNSIRGIQVSSAASIPTRVVYFPSTRLLNNHRVNEALRLAVVSPNSDMNGWEVAAVRAGVVAQIDEGSHQERLTRGALQRENEDRAMAVSYADHNCVVMTPPELEAPVHGTFRIPLGRTTSMRNVGPGRWEEVVGPQRFAHVDLQDARPLLGQGPLLRGTNVVESWVPETSHSENLEPENHTNLGVSGPDRARMQNDKLDNKGSSLEPNVGLIEEFGFLRGASENDLFLHSFTTSIPTTMIPGRIVSVISLREIVNGNGRCAKAVKFAASVDRGLKLVLNCKLAPMSAVGLAVAFVDSGTTGSSVSLKEYMSFQSTIWNPAATSFHIFNFNPGKYGNCWFPMWQGLLESHIVIFMIDGWSSPPKTAAQIYGSFYLGDSRNKEMSFSPTDLGSSLPIGKFLGTIEMEQGVNSAAFRAEMSLGSPSVLSAGFVPTLGTQLLALHAYWQGDLILQLVRTGSSFVGATLACALVAGGHNRTISLSELALIPHHTFVVQADASYIVEKIPAASFGMMHSTDRRQLYGNRRKDRGLQLAIWVKDAVTSATDDKLKFAVSVLAIENLTTCGQGVGYPREARAQNLVGKFYDIAIYDGPALRSIARDSGQKSPLRIRTTGKKKEEEKSSSPEKSEDEMGGDSRLSAIAGFKMEIPLPAIMKMEGVGDGQCHFCCTPMSMLMDSCAYFKGTVLIRMLWIANRTVKFSDLKGSVSYSVHPYGPDGYASDRRSFPSGSGSVEFPVDIEGPFNGYLPVHCRNDLIASPCVKVYVTTPLCIQSVHIQMALTANCKVAGHNVTEDIEVEGASAWSEFYKE